MNTAIGPFKICQHHCFQLGVLFAVPICAPVARLVSVGWVISSAVAASWCPRPLIALSPVLLSTVLCSPVLLVSLARMTLCMPIVAAPRISRPLCAGIGLPLFLHDGLLLAHPLIREICPFHKDAIAHIPDNVHKEQLGKNNARAGAEVECCFYVVKEMISRCKLLPT